MLQRNKFLKLALIVAILLFIALLHRHLFVLAEVVFTYAVFGWQRHLYYDPQPTHHQNSTSTTLATNLSAYVQVPKIFHQIYLSDHTEYGPKVATLFALSKYEDARAACNALHPDWERRLWTNENATAFVSENYPHLLQTYLSYPQTISRTNILRYLLLEHFGGVYLDLDLYCRAKLDSLLFLPWLTPGAHPTGINNAFILSKPHHPFLAEKLIPSIAYHNLRWPLPYVDNMLSTGCMLFSSMYAQWGGRDLYILGGGTKHFLKGHAVTPLFEHFGESSWHSWDAQMFLFVGKYGLLILGCAAVLVAVATLVNRRNRLQKPFQKSKSRIAD
jgi:mannosyltransferase OCH1-like enzyme